MLLPLQNIILEMVAKGESLHRITERLCHEVTALSPEVVVSVLTVDGAGRLHPLAAPMLPDDYQQAIDGMPNGPRAGSCGTAAYLRAPVVVTDIETDLRWARYKSLALPLGLRACWSTPIFGTRGHVIGTFAFYYRTRRGPTKFEKALVATCVHLCAIAIEHDRWCAEQEHRALHDALTGLPNRAAFTAAIEALSCDEPGSWGVMLVDLDNLKTVNDTFGHGAGDELIRHAATAIAQATLPDKTFRLGGDEFAVVVQTPTALENMEAAAAHLLTALEQPTAHEGHLLVPRGTIGGAMLGREDATPESVRRNADFALYHAKETRRGGFIRYWPGIGTRMLRRLESVRRVEMALAEDRVIAHYQPLFDLLTGQIVGFETLCRIREGDTIVAAAGFQDALHDGQIATAITERILGSVAADLAHWRAMGLPAVPVALNLAPADFRAGQLPGRIAQAMAERGAPLDQLVVEVTEAVYLGPGEDAFAETIRELRACGIGVALDDFGTGFASLTHLLTVPVDYLKIDRSFVAQLVRSRASRAIVEGVIHISRELDIRVTAEGIETEAQAQALRDIGCAIGQGYLFSPPVGIEAATTMLRASPSIVARTGKGRRCEPPQAPQIH